MNLLQKTVISILIFFSQDIYSKRGGSNNISYKEYINQNHWFKFIPFEKILKDHPKITYEFCTKKFPFDFKPFPLSIDQSKQPYQGFLFPTFIVHIPDGVVRGMQGTVLIDNQFIDEMIWRACPGFNLIAEQVSPKDVLQLRGKVAVITQVAYDNYFHWMTEVLCRLALLEGQGIEYDYLYVPQKSKFMKTSLAIWGIPESKIIAPNSEKFAVQADEIILPSLVSNSIHGWTQFVNYVQPELLEYVKNKLFAGAQKEIMPEFCKKIFISRKDAPFRKVINEDEVFEKFKQIGFERYELSKLSVAEQIMLFYQADVIVSFQGTGLANSIYCTQKTKIIEIFQALGDCTFWYVSQIFNLNYIPVQTVSFEPDFMKAWKTDTHIPLSVVEKIEKILEK